MVLSEPVPMNFLASGQELHEASSDATITAGTANGIPPRAWLRDGYRIQSTPPNRKDKRYQVTFCVALPRLN
jgi:hypothetical protein